MVIQGRRGVVGKSWGHVPDPFHPGVYRPKIAAIYGPDMPEFRTLPRAFTLADGRVYVLGGGFQGGYSRNPLIFTPTAFGQGQWVMGNYPWGWGWSGGYKTGTPAVQLPDGRIFTQVENPANLITWGILDPIAGTWTATPTACPVNFYNDCGCVLMDDGRVCIGGGQKITTPGVLGLNWNGGIVTYDLVAQTWSQAAAVDSVICTGRSAVLDELGRVAFVGGNNFSGVPGNGILWDPVSDTCSVIPAQFKFYPPAARQPSGYLTGGPPNSFTQNDPWYKSNYGWINPPYNTQESMVFILHPDSKNIWQFGGRVTQPNGTNGAFLNSLGLVANDSTLVQDKTSMLNRTPMPFASMFATLLSDGKTVFFGGGRTQNANGYTLKTCFLEIF